MGLGPVILALNLGSATLKAAHYHCPADDALGLPLRHGERLAVSVAAGDSLQGSPQAADLVEQVAAMLPSDTAAPLVVAYRIVHGGARSAPALITDDLLDELARHEQLAPLHQPAALQLVRAGREKWPCARHVAVFDTSFHSTLADWSRRLPVPQLLHDAGVVRYGFHGIAFQSAIRQLLLLDSGADKQRIVLAHLGSGASLCAVDHGRSVDTTMGLTPLDGLPMATRSGSLDPGVLFFMQRELGMSMEAIERTLWRESGQLGVSGTSSDMQVLLTATDAPAVLAVHQFVMRVAQGIAAMATSLGGMDALVFSGGIGTHSPIICERVVHLLAWTGLRLNATRNEAGASQINAEESRTKVWRLQVDEEFELAFAAAQYSSLETWESCADPD